MLRRAAAVLVIASISALLGWAVLAGITHAFASYTRTVGIVRAALNVNTTDPHDIWIDGASDANQPNPLLFGLFLLVAPPAAAFALWTELTDYSGIRKLLASGAQWRQFEATVTGKRGSRSGITVRMEAEDLSGNVCPFNVFYRFVSPIGALRKGDRVTLTLIANGRWQALIWRPDRKRIYLAHISRSLLRCSEPLATLQPRSGGLPWVGRSDLALPHN